MTVDNPREAVLEEVLARLAEERGIEVLALDWKIIDDLAEAEESKEESAE